MDQKRQKLLNDLKTRTKITNFIKRLYKETCDPLNDHIIFDNEGEKLVIPNKENFVKYSLIKIAKTKDFSGFVRQLNNYGFYKVKNDFKYPEGEIYFNHNFNRNCPENLYNITREKVKESDYKTNINNLVNTLQYLANCNHKQQNMIEELKGRVDKLEIKNQALCEIFGNAFRTGITSLNKENSMNDLDTNKLRLINTDRKDNLIYHNPEPPFQLSSNSKYSPISQNLQLVDQSTIKKTNNQIIKKNRQPLVFEEIADIRNIPKKTAKTSQKTSEERPAWDNFYF
ncbi:heat shock factor protein [Nucleospora cyclopteri]